MDLAKTFLLQKTMSIFREFKQYKKILCLFTHSVTLKVINVLSSVYQLSYIAGLM